MRTLAVTALLLTGTGALVAQPTLERVYSNFDVGNDGWTSTPRFIGGSENGDASQVEYSQTAPASWRNCPFGHNEGLGGDLLDPSTGPGYLMVRDAWRRRGPMGVVAPSAYSTTLADWAADPLTASLTLSFDALELDTTDGGFAYWSSVGVATKARMFGVVKIEGTGGSAWRDFAPFDPAHGTSIQSIADNWTRYSVDLVGAGGLDTRGWTGDLAAALSDVTRIQVVLESRASLHAPGHHSTRLWETAGFDNFTVAREAGQPPPVPELPVAALLLLGLLPLASAAWHRRARG